MIKCPACGATTSSKRQICHMCGHLLAEKEDSGTGMESLDLGGEDLKSIAEAALRELGRGPQKPADRPAPKLVPEQPEKSPSAGTPAKPPARRISPSRAKRGREKMILVISFLVTVAALLSILLGVFRPRGGSLEPAGPSSVPTSAVGVSAGSGTAPQGTPVQNSSPEGTASDATAAPDASASETPAAASPDDLSGEALRPGLNAIIARINHDLGTSLSTNDVVLTASAGGKEESDTVGQISFQAKDFSGSADVLFRSFDYGWKRGWQLTHYRDLQITFTSPVTLSENTANGIVRNSISGATVGTGTYEPIASLAGQEVSYQ
jgi:hypothetical protein